MNPQPGPWFKIRRPDGGTFTCGQQFLPSARAYEIKVLDAPLTIPDPEFELLRLENRELRLLLTNFIAQHKILAPRVRKLWQSIDALVGASHGNNCDACSFDDSLHDLPIAPAKKLLRKAQKRDPI